MRLDDSTGKRDELRKYIGDNRSKLKDAQNAMVDAQMAHGEYSDECKEAREKYKELVTPINEGDETLDNLDKETWQKGEAILSRAEMAIKELRSSLPPGTQSEELGVLQQIFEAAKALRPRDASLETHGIALKPADA